MSALDGLLAARRSGDLEALADALRALAPDYTAHPSGLELAPIPAGRAILGADDDRRAAEMPAFALARHPVTNAQYAQFLAETGAAPSEPLRAHWGGGAPTAELGPHPVVFVSWRDARAWCLWAGLTLPTEWMWEYAARGPDGRRYPWGSARPASKRAVVFDGATRPVGSFPKARTAMGCEDMIGNVSEWCCPSEADAAPPDLEAPSPLMPVRGSAYMRMSTQSGRMTCAHRRVLSVDRRNHWVGFRAALI